MDMTFVPSLEHILLAKLAIMACNNPDLWAVEKNFRIPFSRVPKVKEEIIQRKITDYELCKRLQKKVRNLVSPIVAEIRKWRDYHSYILDGDADVELLSSLYWKSEGAIDTKRTAESLVRRDSLDKIDRFVLACEYCLEEDLRRLWNRMSESERRKASNEKSPHMVKAWIAKLVDGSQYARSSLYTSNYKLAAWGFEHNVEMLRYYLQQCSTSEEKQRYLVKFARLTYANIDVIRYAFPLMDSNTQELVLRRTPFITLRCFLDWPLQTVFMNVANRMWNYLSEEDFCVMLRYILFDRIFRESRDFNYVDLLKEFWYQSPTHFKEFVWNLHENSIFFSVKASDRTKNPN